MKKTGAAGPERAERGTAAEAHDEERGAVLVGQEPDRHPGLQIGLEPAVVFAVLQAVNHGLRG